MGRSLRLVVVALVTALAVAACGGKDEAGTQASTPNASTPQVVDDGSLAAGQKISARQGEVVLTVTGDIGTANKGKKLELDLASLGCQDGQGFLFARPLNPEAMTELLAKSLADGGFYLPVAQNLEAAVGT